MSYRCQKCGSCPPAGTPRHTVPALTKTVYFPSRSKANTGYTLKGETVKKSKRNADRTDDPGGQGKQIVAEMHVCPECYSQFFLLPQNS